MKFTHLKWFNPLHWCRWWYHRRFVKMVQKAMSSKQAIPLDDNDCAAVEAWVRDYLRRRRGTA